MMNDSGFSEKEIFDELKAVSAQNTDFRKVMSSMCTIPHPVAIKAHNMFILSNLGDPGLFEGTHLLEKKVIEDCAELLHHPSLEYIFGHMTTGGTESNIDAVYQMKYLFQKKHGTFGHSEFSERSEYSGKLNLIVPNSAHFSFEKAGKLLDIEIRRASVDPYFRVDLESVRSLIDENTIGLVGIAGTTEFGYVDPISGLSEIALEFNLPLHIDAAFGGFVLPFLPESFSEDTDLDFNFDFSLPGVSSIALDPHKMGLSTIPSGIIIYRNKEYCQGLDIKTHYLTYPIQSTLPGTRTGASAAATYAVMKYLGKSGYRKNVIYCLHLKDFFLKEAEKYNLKPAIAPVLNIVTIPFKDHETVSEIRLQMKKRFGWHISATRQIPALRFVLMPHVTENDIREMFKNLSEVLKDMNLLRNPENLRLKF